MAAKAGRTSCALGPHAVGTLDDTQHLCAQRQSFSSATIYFPQSGGGQLPTVILVGGMACGERALAAWAPFFASHGIVAMTIGTPKPWTGPPPARSQALLDASVVLQSENTRVSGTGVQPERPFL